MKFIAGAVEGHAGGAVMTRTSPRTGRDPLVNARRRANGGKSGDILVPCRFCLKRFKPKSRLNRFCESRHRLLFWAAGELVKEIAAGKAAGIRDVLERKYSEERT
jgi:hypothetical protein